MHADACRLPAHAAHAVLTKTTGHTPQEHRPLGQQPCSWCAPPLAQQRGMRCDLLLGGGLCPAGPLCALGPCALGACCVALGAACGPPCSACAAWAQRGRHMHSCSRTGGSGPVGDRRDCRHAAPRQGRRAVLLPAAAGAAAQGWPARGAVRCRQPGAMAGTQHSCFPALGRGHRMGPRRLQGHMPCEAHGAAQRMRAPDPPAAAAARLVRWELAPGEGGQACGLAGSMPSRCLRSRSVRYRLHSRGDSLLPCAPALAQRAQQACQVRRVQAAGQGAMCGRCPAQRADQQRAGCGLWAAYSSQPARCWSAALMPQLQGFPLPPPPAPSLPRRRKAHGSCRSACQPGSRACGMPCVWLRKALPQRTTLLVRCSCSRSSSAPRCTVVLCACARRP